MAGIGSQAERSVFTSTQGKIAPAICYESIYGEYFTQYIRNGAQAAVVVTNDGWWDNTAGHRQHMYLASLRAIETRRDVVRSAYTGVSAFINQRGEVLQTSKYDEEAALKGDIHLNDEITFYVRWGDILARLALFSSILLILNVFVRSRLTKAQQKP